MEALECHKSALRMSGCHVVSKDPLVDAMRAGADSKDLREVIFLGTGAIRALYEDAGREGKSVGEVAAEVRPLLAKIQTARRSAGPEQREIDLDLGRIVRRSGRLFCVVGAGATIDAGGPSWPALVRSLLETGLGDGFHIAETKRDLSPSEVLKFHVESTNICDLPDWLKQHLERVENPVHTIQYKKFPEAEAAEAQMILEEIKRSLSAEGPELRDEILKRGAEIAWLVAEQHIFALVTNIIYEKSSNPGKIHRAIARLSCPMTVGPSGEQRPGVQEFFTYNYDDLLGMAIDDCNLARASYAACGSTVKADANEIARPAGPAGPHVRILHLHGYSPIRFFNITDITYALAESQYISIYDSDENKIVDCLKKRLADSSLYALYIGCSFIDTYMNRLLEEAAKILPGRDHWALLQWKGREVYKQASGEEIVEASQRYWRMGVQPIWFDKFEEIPGLISRYL